MADMILAGFGGQGILTAGKILIDVAAREGKNVSWTSSYGAEMRGGTASCSIVISDEEIGSPYPTKLDVLLAMNEPSYCFAMRGLQPVFGSMRECIESAVAGKVVKEAKPWRK